ncbi:hypothetical protein ABZT02_40695 [Streptomyces sp. NPDC005402]|uniref:hypothetical protein n=1 Tax=Streptomyces sp. NPDC005402 TaxID=3155338 RepID=UPI0033BC7A4E
MADHGVERAARRLTQAVIVRSAVTSGDFPPDEGRRLAGSLEEEAGRFGPGRPTDEPPAPSAALDRELCAFLAVILARRGPDIHDYLAGVIGYRPERPAGQRHDCGNQLLIVPMVPRWLNGAVRDLHVCERCGPCYSLPSNAPSPLACTLHARALHLQFREPLASGAWYTACRQPIGGHPERALPVRHAPSGACHLCVERPADAGAGLRRFAVALVADGDYATFQLPLEARARK